MEAESLYPISVHHGHIIRRLRVNKGLNQQDLGTNVGLSQQSISDYEKKRVIEDEILARFAKYFKIPLEDLKEMEEDKPSMFIENNVFETSGNSTSNNLGYNETEGSYNTTNNCPIEKIAQLYEDKITLLNLLLKDEKEKVGLLEKQVQELNQKLATN